jgi:hypothetical protein
VRAYRWFCALDRTADAQSDGYLRKPWSNSLRSAAAATSVADTTVERLVKLDRMKFVDEWSQAPDFLVPMARSTSGLFAQLQNAQSDIVRHAVSKQPRRGHRPKTLSAPETLSRGGGI